ncbi:Glutamyl-tRNA amidotransferase B subunit [Neoconidiobolus thromboides FSU 785]|nr:Glutamyl-tRNA amidotransferase B subunit [Neoconidiobolus thromboides FSU 785]
MPLLSHLKTSLKLKVKYQCYTTTASQRVNKIRSKSNQEYEVNIGLEIHTQLNTNEKLFSTSNNLFTSKVNQNINCYDSSYPGVLPILNQDCLKKAVELIIAINGTIQPHSSFDRKHYFYPDMPQGYQITQKYEPIGKGGSISLNYLDGLSYPLEINIEQVQLEQDSGNLIQEENNVKINLNRVNVPLIELVTRPDFINSLEVVTFIKKYQTLVRSLGVSLADLEIGTLRCDINLSIKEYNSKIMGNKIELKNLNNFKIIRKAIDYEIQRQIELIESSQLILPETRSYNQQLKKTYKLRTKQTSEDYRYMNEPDLPRIKISPSLIESIKTQLPVTPYELLIQWEKQYKLNNIQLNAVLPLIHEPKATEFLNNCIKLQPKLDFSQLTHWLSSILLGILSKQKLTFKNITITEKQFLSVINEFNLNNINSKTSKYLIIKMLNGDLRLAKEIIQQEDLGLIKDETILLPIINKLIKENSIKFKKLKESKDKRQMAWFLGKIMLLTENKACPEKVNQLLMKIEIK